MATIIYFCYVILKGNMSDTYLPIRALVQFKHILISWCTVSLYSKFSPVSDECKNSIMWLIYHVETHNDDLQYFHIWCYRYRNLCNGIWIFCSIAPICGDFLQILAADGLKYQYLHWFIITNKYGVLPFSKNCSKTNVIFQDIKTLICITPVINLT
jgi:hypothetical protein